MNSIIFWWVGSDFDVNQPTSYQIQVFQATFGSTHYARFRTLAFSTSIELDFKSWNIFPKEFNAGDTGSSSVQSKCLGVYAGKVFNFTYILYTSFHKQGRKVRNLSMDQNIRQSTSKGRRRLWSSHAPLHCPQKTTASTLNGCVKSWKLKKTIHKNIQQTSCTKYFSAKHDEHRWNK